MSLDSANNVVRLVVYPPLTTKGSDLTPTEADTNFVNLYKDLAKKEIAQSLDAYSAIVVYSQTNAVLYSSKNWVYINAAPTAGIQPGTDPDYWVEVDPTYLVHRRNSDTKLAEFTDDEVSASDLKELVSTASNRVRITKTFDKTEVNDFFQAGYVDAYVVYAGVVGKGYRLLNPPVMEIDDDGTPFTSSSGENLFFVNSNEEPMASFGDPLITASGVSKSQGAYFYSFGIVDGSDIRVYSSYPVGGGGAASTITFILDIEIFDF